jgi:hypothetical protein
MTKIRLAVLGLSGLVAAALGCGGSSSCSGNVAAEWVLTQNGAPVSCLPGDEVDINVDSMSATFACSAGGGTTPAVTAGVSHNVSLSLFDSSNNLLSMTQTMSLFVPCGTITDIGQVDFAL